MTVEPFQIPFTILIDAAEQHPFSFNELFADADKDYRPLVVPTRYCSLGRHPNSLGDYSIEGMIGRVAVERKSMSDCQGTVLGWETPAERKANKVGRRQRFEQELENLSKVEAALVVVEATFEDCLASMPEHGKKSSQENAKIFNRSIQAYMQDYKVPWHFAGSRRTAELFTFQYLRRFWKYHK